jgi:hypothetical protein
MSNKLIFQHYAVAFLDLVGQREALRKLLAIPSTQDDELAFIETARQSLGRVLELRRIFEGFFQGFCSPPHESSKDDLSRIPVEHHDTIRAAMETEYIMTGMSDSLVIAVPLGGEDENCKAMNGLELMILSICGMALNSFSIGLVFRGGLDVGIATLIDANEIYGSALSRAIYLENDIAEYPRYVVGNELISYLDTVVKQDPKTKPGLVAQQNAIRCRKMIVQDTDGRQMLDFLGGEVRTALNDATPVELFSKGLDFVQNEYKRFLKAGNDKLASRYFRLFQYYLARKKAWGL